jgi:antitoxin ParD1/3/4
MAMNTIALNLALSETMRRHVDQRVRSGEFGDTGDYLRALIRRDQEEQSRQRLRELVAEGLNSGPGQVPTPARVADLKQQALARQP